MSIWLVVWIIFYFYIYWKFHNPNWRTHIFQRGWNPWNHQPGIDFFIFVTNNLEIWRFNGMIADDVDGKRVFAFTCRLRPEVLLGGQWFRHFEANCTALEGWFMVVPRNVVTAYWETIFFIDDSKRQALIILCWRVSWWKEWWFEHVQLQRLDMCPKSIWNRCNF